MAPGDSASLIDPLTREQKSGGLFLFTPTNPQTTEVGFLIFLQIYQITLYLSLSSLGTWWPATPSTLSSRKFGNRTNNPPLNALAMAKCKIVSRK